MKSMYNTRPRGSRTAASGGKYHKSSMSDLSSATYIGAPCWEGIPHEILLTCKPPDLLTVVSHSHDGGASSSYSTTPAGDYLVGVSLSALKLSIGLGLTNELL